MIDDFFNLAATRNWKQALVFFIITIIFFSSVMTLVRMMIGEGMEWAGMNSTEALQRSWMLTQQIVVVLGPCLSFLIIRAKRITGLKLVAPLIVSCLLSWFGVPGAMLVPALLTTRPEGKSS